MSSLSFVFSNWWWYGSDESKHCRTNRRWYRKSMADEDSTATISVFHSCNSQYGLWIWKAQFAQIGWDINGWITSVTVLVSTKSLNPQLLKCNKVCHSFKIGLYWIWTRQWSVWSWPLAWSASDPSFTLLIAVCSAYKLWEQNLECISTVKHVKIMDPGGCWA